MSDLIAKKKQAVIRRLFEPVPRLYALAWHGVHRGLFFFAVSKITFVIRSCWEAFTALTLMQ